jgi:O-antigen ligase
MIPWEDSVIIAGVGRVSRVAGLPIAAFWAATVLTTGRFRKLRPFHLSFFLLILWNFLTLLWSVNVNSTLDRLMTYVQLAGMIWLIWDLYLTKDAIRMGLQAYVLGASISAIDTISNYLSGISRGSTPRYAATGFNANGLAIVLVLGLPLAWYLAVSINPDSNKKLQLLRLINFAHIPVAVFAILLTASRTALFSLIPIAWFMLSSFAKLRPIARLIVSVGIIAALYIVQPLVPQTSIDRLSTASSEFTEGDLSGRREIWGEAIGVFWQNPILGTGSGTFKEVVAFKDKSAHNMYISLLVESGLLGFMFYFGVVLLAAYHIRYMPRDEAGLWLAIIIAWAIGNYTGNWEVKKHTWLFISLIVVNANLYLSHTSSPVTELHTVSRQVQLPIGH